MTWAMIWVGLTAWLSAVILWLNTDLNWPTCLGATTSYKFVGGKRVLRLYQLLLTPQRAWLPGVLRSTYVDEIRGVLIFTGLDLFVIVNVYTAGTRVIWSMARH